MGLSAGGALDRLPPCWSFLKSPVSIQKISFNSDSSILVVNVGGIFTLHHENEINIDTKRNRKGF